MFAPRVAALPPMQNPQRFIAVQEHIRSQNSQKLQNAQILLGNPRYLNDLRKLTNQLKLVQAEHVKVLQVLVNNPYNILLKEQHITLSKKIGKLESKIQTVVNNYNTILADAESAKLALQDNNVQFSDQLVIAHAELQSLLPKQFVSGLTSKITNMVQQQAPTQYLQDFITKYTEIVHVSRFEHAELEQFLSVYEEQQLFLEQQKNTFDEGFPQTLWTLFRTKTLPNANDRITQETARIEAKSIADTLLELMKIIQPLPAFDVKEPQIGLWNEQLQWLLWAEMNQKRIAWLLHEQQFYGMYISVLLAQRALGVVVLESVLTNARDHIAMLTQNLIPPPQNQPPNFELTWKLLMEDASSAQFPQDESALKRTLRTVQRALQFLQPPSSSSCITEAQDALRTYLACSDATCVLPSSNMLAQKCISQFVDVSTDLKVLEDAVEQSIQNLQCENTKACVGLKTELLTTHKLQIKFLQNSVQLLNKKQLTEYMVKHEELRLHLPLLHVVGATPLVDQKRQILLDNITRAAQEITLIYGISFALQSFFPNFPQNNFPLFALQDLEKHVKNKCQQKTLSDVQACVMQYTPSETFPDLNGFVTTKDVVLQQYLDEFEILITTFVNDIRAEISTSHAALQNLRHAALSVHEMTDLNNLQLQETAALGSCDMIKDKFKNIMDDLLQNATNLHLEVLNNLQNASYEKTKKHVPYSFQTKLQCKVHFESDLALHTSAQRQDFISTCEALGEDDCIVLPEEECILYQNLLREYQTSASKPHDMAVFAVLKPQAIAAYNIAEGFKIEIEAAELQLETMYGTAKPQLLATDVDLYDEMKSSSVLSINTQEAANVQTLLDHIEKLHKKLIDANATLAIIATKIDALFPQIDLIDLIFTKLLRVRTLSDYVWIIFKVVEKFGAFNPNMFPIAHYSHLKAVVNECSTKSTATEQVQCVLNSVEQPIDSKYEGFEKIFNRFIQDAAYTPSYWDFSDAKTQIESTINPALDNIASTMSKASSTEIEQQTAFDDLQNMQTALLTFRIHFSKNLAQTSFKLHNDLVEAILNIPTSKINKPSAVQTIELCLPDLKSDMSKHTRKDRVRFQTKCEDLMNPETGSCFSKKALCPLYINLVQNYKSVILPDISSHQDYLRLSTALLDTNNQIRKTRSEYLQKEDEWKKAWAKKWTIPTFDIANNKDWETAQTFAENVWTEYLRNYNTHVVELSKKKHEILEKLKQLEMQFIDQSNEVDALFIEAFKIKDNSDSSNWCERSIEHSVEWDPATHNDLVNKCNLDCKDLSQTDTKQCIEDLKILDLAKKHILPATKNALLDVHVQKLTADRIEIEAKNDNLNRLMQEAKSRYNDLTMSSRQITQVQLSTAQDKKNEIKDAQDELENAKDIYKTHLSEYAQTYQDLVAQFKLPFGEEMFEKVKPFPVGLGDAKTSITSTECITRTDPSNMLDYSQVKREEFAKVCEVQEQACKNNINPTLCLNNKLAEIKPSSNNPVANRTKIQALMQTVVDLQKAAQQSANTDLIAAFTAWKTEVQSGVGNKAKLEQLGKEFEAQQLNYVTQLVNMVLAQTMLDLEILQVPKPQYIYDKCVSLFDTNNRKIEWSIASRYFLIAKCHEECIAKQVSHHESIEICKNTKLALLLEAHAVNVSLQYDTNVLNELQVVRTALDEAYAQAQQDWFNIEMLRTNIVQEAEELKQYDLTSLSLDVAMEKETQIVKLRIDLEILLHNMSSKVLNAETAFNKVFENKVRKEVNMTAFEAYDKEFRSKNDTVNEFQRNFSNVRQFRQILQTCRPDATHSAATILQFLPSVAAANAHFLTTSIIPNTYREIDVQMLQDEVKQLDDVLVEIEKQQNSYFATRNIIASQDRTKIDVLRDPNTLEKWYVYIETIQNFNKHLSSLKTLNDDVVAVQSVPHVCSALAAEPTFQSICSAQTCKTAEACIKLEEYADKILKDRNDLIATITDSSKIGWLRASVELRFPQELALFALGPFEDNYFTQAYKELQGYFHLPLNRNTALQQQQQQIKFHPHAIETERAAWELLDSRKTWLMQFATTLQNMQHLQDRILKMKNSDDSIDLGQFIIQEEACLKDIMDELKAGDLFKMASDIATNLISAIPNYNYFSFCNKPDSEVIRSLEPELQHFQQNAANWKNTMGGANMTSFETFRQYALVQSNLIELQERLQLLQTMIEAVEEPDETNAPYLAYLKVLGVESPLDTLQTHLESLYTCLQNVIVVRETIRDSDISSSTLDAACIPVLKQKLTTHSQTIENILHAFWKLLQTSDPTKKEYFLQSFVDLKLLLTC